MTIIVNRDLAILVYNNTIAGLKFALAVWVPYIHDNLQLFNSETYSMITSMVTRCFSVYACGQVLFRSGSKLVVPSAVHGLLNLTYDHSLLNMSIRLCGIGSRRVEEYSTNPTQLHV